MIAPAPFTPARSAPFAFAFGEETDDVIARRLQDSVTELSHWHEFKYVVVNDKFGEALDALIAIVKGKGEPQRSTRPEFRTLAAGLLA